MSPLHGYNSLSPGAAGMKGHSSAGLTGGGAHRGRRYDSEDDDDAEEGRSEDEARLPLPCSRGVLVRVRCVFCMLRLGLWTLVLFCRDLTHEGRGRTSSRA